jgi:hypothetical protein
VQKRTKVNVQRKTLLNCVPVLNLVTAQVAEDMDAYKADVKAQLREVGWAPVVCTIAR